MNKYNYIKESYYRQQHYQRFKKFVESKKLVCQDCHGEGGYKEVILDDGTGPWFECGWCEGTGFTSPWLRGIWLTFKRQDKNV